MVRGFESNLSQTTEGQKLSFSLMPAEAYGLRNINNTQRIPTKYLKHEGKLTAGKQIKVNTDSGVRHGTIIKAGKFNADVDMNHPLAGKTYTSKWRLWQFAKLLPTKFRRAQFLAVSAAKLN